MKIIIAILITFSTTAALAKKNERFYQDYHCQNIGGISEYRPANDRFVRIDCELDNYSIEVDFAKKHYEAVGQSLYYAALTRKRAGIWLIIKKPKQMKHAVRLVRNIRMNQLPISVWLIKQEPGDTSSLVHYYE